VAYSVDGKYLVTTAGVYPPYVTVWQAKGKGLARIRRWEGGWSANCAVFLPDGQTVVSAGGTGYREHANEFPIYRWNMRTGRHRKPLCGHTEDVFALACSPDGSLLATGSADRTARVWDAASGEQTAQRNISGWVNGVAFAPSGRCLAVAAGRGVFLWDVADQRGKVRSLRGHTGSVLGVAFHLTGRTVASASEDGTVRLWDVASGTERASYDWKIGQIGCVAFAPDGQTAAVGGADGTIVVWDVEE
jgi:WD40 repeat protein